MQISGNKMQCFGKLTFCTEFQNNQKKPLEILAVVWMTVFIFLESETKIFLSILHGQFDVHIFNFCLVLPIMAFKILLELFPNLGANLTQADRPNQSNRLF